MCGIAGLVSFSGSTNPDLIRNMSSLLRHRGPDDEGYLAGDFQPESVAVTPLWDSDSVEQTGRRVSDPSVKANVFLAHRRLSILDLSTLGHQPMQYGDGLWIVFNGEIYNYLEIRRELKAQGYVFKTGSDTEVILAAYDCWGEECVVRFNGDWAFCILDVRRQVLFLSRDRFGVKPLYYFKSDSHFVFASEIKAILSLPFITRSPYQQSIRDYFTLFCIDHTENTLWESIHQLSPGHNMRVNMRTREARTWQYYTLSYTPELGNYDDTKAKSYAADIRELLFDAVRLRLRADVPIGTCLSGGLDSSSVVAITAQILRTDSVSQTPRTFTASYPGTPLDESRFAREVIERTGAVSHFTFPSREAFWNKLPILLHHYDEPFGGPSFYAQWEVMHAASEHVKVVIDGQGGDEVFGGYSMFRAALFAQMLGAKKVGSIASEFLSTIKNMPNLKQAAYELKLIPYVTMSNSVKARIHRLRYRAQLKKVKQICDFGDYENFDHLGRMYSANLNESLVYSMTMYSLPHLLKYEDRNSMAHSIEARVPFTDYRLVDYVFGIPSIFKIHNGWSKWLLRLAMQDILPDSIVWRKDKLGFATPGWASRQEISKVWMEAQPHSQFQQWSERLCG